MNISPVSFKGTFAVKQQDISNRCCQKLISKTGKYNYTMSSGNCDNSDTLFIQTPYSTDAQVEKFLRRLKLNFSRIHEGKALEEENIVSRLCLSDWDKVAGAKLCDVDVSKLDKELKKNKSMYVGFEGYNGSRDKYNSFVEYLKTNQSIHTPKIYLERENNGEISTHISDGRHRFAVLRDRGIEKMPVVIDKNSIELAREVGLIE